MRGQKKNQKSFYYATWKERKDQTDEFGNVTGSPLDVYNTPVQFNASKSAGQGNAEESPFGINVQYDSILMSFDMTLPIDEKSLIWYKNTPTYDLLGVVKPDSADYRVSAPPLDSLNCIRIAISKRIVGG